ncbi:PAS domain S-box protein [Neobacillus niacini]|uniref:PAS domain S-box protein n=1 Tax=Neobacillus niacini TaxID=86668 RepID=UPI0028612B89|nr:PAS domain S-box protein [Neobacillus niacini]MDR7002644.1 PAS domain S-box-containing protein [Neobacillus niacini]
MVINNLIALDKNSCLKSEKLKLESEWEKFIFGNHNTPIIRPLMFDSWQRCLNHGISPLQSKTSINLSEEQIKEYKITDPVFRIFKPVLTRLKDLYMDSGHLITFCNPSGDIVYLDGDLSLMLKAEDMNFVPGSSWAENLAGTNAIGTAIATGFPIQVFAGEHFCQEVQKWTCSAAPIRDPATQKVMGVIDLTGLWAVNDPYFLSVVTSAAADINRILFNQLKMERFNLLEYYQSQTISRRTFSHLVVLDRGWKVIKASPFLYEQGLIDSNHFLVGVPSLSLSLTLKTHWELEHSKGIWRFELTPYIYGGVPIGAVVQAIPPIITNGKNISLAGNNSNPRVMDGTPPLLSNINNGRLIPDFNHKDRVEVKKTFNNEGFYKAFFDHNPDGIFSCDLQANVLEANPALERMLGYSVKELQQLPVESLYLPEYLESGLEYLEKTIKGNPQEYEVAIKHKNGYRADIKVKSFPTIIDNEIVGVYGIVKDITKDKQMEADLQLTKQQLDLFLKNTVDTITIFDLQLNVIKVNEAFEKVFGWTEQEVIGRRVPIIPDFLVEQYTENLRNMMNNRYIMTFETIRQRKDGSLIDVRSFVSPIVNANGNVTAFVSIIRDITEHKRMEEALKESEKRLRTLINAMPDIVIFKDGEGRWLEANDHALKIFQFENVPYRGKKDSELAVYKESYRDTLTFCEKSDQEAWKNGRETRTEEVMMQHDGKSVIFDVIKVPIFYPDGRRKGLLIIGRDITELKQTEELLRKSEKLAVVGQLSAGIAHEIRNPLTSLKGFLSLMQSSIAKKDDWYLDVMVSEINRIDSITNQFMAVAKPQAVTIQLQNLKELIQQVLVVVYPEATMNNIQIFIEAEDDIPLIQCEVNQLKQVFINILKNSIEAMRSGGGILVQIKKLDQNRVLIRCIDKGCGIPQERIPHLGEPFYSLKEKGTGLGLMMSYKIIEEHQGKITIESELNKGTIVDVILPIPPL